MDRYALDCQRHRLDACILRTQCELRAVVIPQGKFDACSGGCYHHNAGWSSLVARWAHNPKVGGSNPPPATKSTVWFQWVEPISNWLGDSKPNFPALILGFLYAKFYATPVKGTFRHSRPTSALSWELPFGWVKLPQQGCELLLPSCACCTASAASAQFRHSQSIRLADAIVCACE